jgi:hypothetical protein
VDEITWRVATRERLWGESFQAQTHRTVEAARQHAVRLGEQIEAGALPKVVQVVIEFDNGTDWQLHEVAWQRLGATR